MRIISGTARGRQLAAFSGNGVRPTPDRVREALFSILQSRFGSFAGLSVLELFAGSGAQSLEALSRDAGSAIAIDSSPESIKLIAENAKRCKLEEKLQIRKLDVFNALDGLQAEGPFDLILLDPPYNKEHIPRALQRIEALQLLSEDGIICAESASDEKMSDCGRLRLERSRKYGSSMLHLYSWNED